MPSVIDLFCGAGGFSNGFERAGFTLRCGIDTNAHACATMRANHPPDTPILCAAVNSDVANIVCSSPCDVIVGGPPCQPFSQAHKRAEGTTRLTDPWLDDPRNGIPAFFAVVQRVLPRAFVMENVKQVRKYMDSHIEPQFLDALRQHYDIYNKVLDAQDYGVPQHRERFFIVGVPRGAPFAWPTPRETPVPVRTVLSDTLDPVGSPITAAIRYCRTPVLNRTLQSSYVVNGAGRPLNLDRPSPTITASTGGAHTHIIDRNRALQNYYDGLVEGTVVPRTGDVEDEAIRRLTMREMARIQTFDDAYVFEGPRTAVCRQIGNAVPPQLAYSIATSVRAALESITA